MKLLLGTANKGKAIEISAALKGLIPKILMPTDLAIEGSPDENFPTLRENALSKARFYFEQSHGVPTIADDTGLYVEALKNELGVKTRRWGAGADAPDNEWLAYFLKRMESETDRRAKFIAVVAFIDEDGAEHLFESDAKGTIVHEPQAEYLPGLPVSSVFLPDGYDRVFSALTHDEKNSLSHRGKAVAQFMEYVRNRINPA